jgi:hypothetical protein
LIQSIPSHPISLTSILILKHAIFWDVVPCSSCMNLLTLVPRLWIFLPWQWRRYIPLKRRFIQELQGATSQKTAFFIVAAVKTSYLTF